MAGTHGICAHPHGDGVCSHHRRRASLHDGRGSMPRAQWLLSNHAVAAALSCARTAFTFATENDTEVAAGYLSREMRAGRSLGRGAGIRVSFGSRRVLTPSSSAPESGFGVLRDPIACKPAVMAETDDTSPSAPNTEPDRPARHRHTRAFGNRSPRRVYFWEHADSRMKMFDDCSSSHRRPRRSIAACMSFRRRRHQRNALADCSIRPASMLLRSASTRRSISRSTGHVGYFCGGMNKRARIVDFEATPGKASART